MSPCFTICWWSKLSKSVISSLSQNGIIRPLSALLRRSKCHTLKGVITFVCFQGNTNTTPLGLLNSKSSSFPSLISCSLPESQCFQEAVNLLAGLIADLSWKACYKQALMCPGSRNKETKRPRPLNKVNTTGML